MDMDKFNAALEKQTADFLVSHQKFCESVLGFSPGERGVIGNAKVRIVLRDL